MGRRYEYFCDNCGKEFGQFSHINGKGMQIYHSRVMHYESGNPKATQWKQHPILNGSDEKHFCNGKCFGEFIDTHTPKEMVFGEGTIGKHIFDQYENCIKCGCSKNAVNNFKWECTVKRHC